MNGSAILTQPTLVLNRSWQAICTTSVRHAIVLLYRGRAKVISPDTYELHDIDSWADLSKIKSGPKVHGVSFSMPVPEVVILTGCDVYPKPKVVFSRRNIFKRDRFTCQYCGSHPKMIELTIDHVLPKSRRGRSTWENCVVSCRDCNEKKGNRTPTEAGLVLKSTPKRPAWLPFVAQNTSVRPSWEKFLGDLYWNVELDQTED
ncbi:MAG: HNH endonuclease [Candidatus Omnitrophica bacterium]|nr:HNH endonuclease [Candidatus Omnitrophota bacterium]MCA9416621.1 HNH endonuclease [Candidatus Omnitrophota bacterium]MCA9423564.1 HNH endonuclease [Candidatus Omnitrophota bacterium]MCA9429199.1 HNH endonuclease [Candidatus Omnitrophota bacterium]MCA9435076.1 HNH endonuclease [Candidatus Omnitrophota bacterium]